MAYSSTFNVADTNDLKDVVLVNLDATTATEVQPLGSVVESVDGRRYQHVYWDSTGAEVLYQGSPLLWGDSTTDFMVEGDFDNSAGGLDDGAGAGTAGVSCVDNTDNNHMYMWIQTDGFCPGARVGTAVAANDLLIASTTDFFEKQDYVTSVGSGTDQVICAFALGAATNELGYTAGDPSSADVMLHCSGS